MPITFNCACGKTLRVPDASAGKRAKCPACAAVIPVPEPEPVVEVVGDAPPPPLPPDPGAEPPVALPPLPVRGYTRPKFDEEEEDKTPYGLAEPEPRGPDLDRDGTPRKKDGLPNFNKGRKKFGGQQ